VQVFAQSGVGHNPETGKIYFGSPASEASIKKGIGMAKATPEIWDKLRKLEEKH
jgi:UDP-3-O-[3-hydroxymyristoyl] glucosamine N-acyltransferase